LITSSSSLVPQIAIWKTVSSAQRKLDLEYQEIVGRRRALIIEPFKSLAEVGFDRPWVTPYQITSKSSEGPVLVALHWLDESSILRERATLHDLGYLPNIRFNTVIDAALARLGLSRSDIYVTQAFHLIARTRSERISQAAIRHSFDEITRFDSGRESDRDGGYSRRRMRAA
jgi:hypothetical protein